MAVPVLFIPLLPYGERERGEADAQISNGTIALCGKSGTEGDADSDGQCICVCCGAGTAGGCRGTEDGEYRLWDFGCTCTVRVPGHLGCHWQGREGWSARCGAYRRLLLCLSAVGQRAILRRRIHRAWGHSAAGRNWDFGKHSDLLPGKQRGTPETIQNYEVKIVHLAYEVNDIYLKRTS